MARKEQLAGNFEAEESQAIKEYSIKIDRSVGSVIKLMCRDYLIRNNLINEKVEV